MKFFEILKNEFDGEEGSFLLKLRCELDWDWDAFQRLTSAMYEVAKIVCYQNSIETWITHGFWFCDTWIREYTTHPDFPKPEKQAHEDALELIHDLAYFLFVGESPFEDNTLEKKAKG